eukprot:CAMPEP_0170331346 /NCGR_PEP_ID=MMETSP0116_2-20130129/66650_1 /TAXON_ID=400756 /ORGANISM="Durinskia baltica, Strain CSIRO CS-38" /LENGTH=143 /DNA_ID=CAMNT_0010584603 /DNA_START=49 /DNA_END=477 /DNA_ORIENTATION=-
MGTSASIATIRITGARSIEASAGASYCSASSTSRPGRECEEKATQVLERMRGINDVAQSQRMESVRPTADRGRPDFSHGIHAELDSRCRWLVGALHLAVRKMQERNEGVDKIREVMRSLLDQVRELPRIVSPDFQATTLPSDL